jgi:hypothetical protein
MQSTETNADALADDWIDNLARAYPTLTPADIAGIRCAHDHAGLFFMAALLVAAQVPTDG